MNNPGNWEDDEADQDRERHREAAHNRETGIFHEHASAELKSSQFMVELRISR